MSANQYVTFHETLGKKPNHHHHHNRRPHFAPMLPWGYAESLTSSVDDEVAFHEAKHDVVILGPVGRPEQVRQAVVERLRARGWVQTEKNGIVLLSPPGLVAAMKGLGIIHGLGDITPEPALTPSEFMGVGVGGAMAITGIVLEGKLGLVLGIVGGLIAAIGGGSALMRAMKPSPPFIPPPPPNATPQQVAAYNQAVAAQQYGSQYGMQTGQYYQPAAAAPPPPPPPPKLTSQQRLISAVSAYGPIASELVKGVISLF